MELRDEGKSADDEEGCDEDEEYEDEGYDDDYSDGYDEETPGGTL